MTLQMHDVETVDAAEARKIETHRVREMCRIGSEPLKAGGVFVMRDPAVPVREVHFYVLIHGAIVPRPSSQARTDFPIAEYVDAFLSTDLALGSCDNQSVATARESMDAALKRAVASRLRPLGFKGSLPHLRRRSDRRIDLISVQYFSSGGSFVVEVAACGPDGYTTSWGKHIDATKVRAQDIPTPRPRLGSENFPEFGDHWFVFGPRNYEAGSEKVYPPQHYDDIAADVIRLVAEQAEPFWREVALG